MGKRKYEQTFVQEAIKLADEIGVRKAALQLGISINTLSYWRTGKAERIAKKESTTIKDPKVIEVNRRNKEITAEYDKVVKENEKLQEKIDILMDTISFFALDRKS